jgi:hypothetical protein
MRLDARVLRCVECRREIPTDRPPERIVFGLRNGKIRGEVCDRCTEKARAEGRLRLERPQ